MEFQVSEILEGSIVSGRNGRTDIPVGTVFTEIVKYRFEGEVGNKDRKNIGVVANIELKLVAVGWYHREIDHIPGGHTAGLKFTGNGLNELREQLEQLQSSEYVHLKV
jgi:hypothetical protein